MNRTRALLVALLVCLPLGLLAQTLNAPTGLKTAQSTSFDPAGTGHTHTNVQDALAAALAAVPVNTAPGMVGSLLTMETLEWIWQLEKVPFPTAIDQGQWTDYYYNASAADDTGDGLTRSTARKTIGDAVTTLFGGGYRRLNMCGDFDVASGAWDQNWGKIQDAAITPGSCPTDVTGALAQPCYWIRETPGCTTTFDSTGTTDTAGFFNFSPEADRTHLLVEGIDYLCDTDGSDSSCFTTDEAGILTVVGGSGEVTQNIIGSGNIVSCHDVSVTHVYGNVPMSYSGTASGSNPLIASQYGCTIAVHTSALLDGAPTTTTAGAVITASQSGGSIPSSLEAEALSLPAHIMVTGAHMRTSASTHQNQVITIDPEYDAANFRSGMAEVVTISTYLDNRSTSAVAVYVDFNALTGNSTASLTMLYPTFGVNTTGDPRHIHNGNGSFTSTDTMTIRIAGAIIRTLGMGTALNFFRLADPDFADNSAGSISLTDILYDSLSTSSWRIWYAATQCSDETATELAACINAQSAGIMSVSNDNDIVESSAWTDADGVCDVINDRACEDLVAGATAAYTIDSFNDRAYTPAFITGRQGTGFLGTPVTQNEVGRVSAP